jgi:hypothetical protein
MLKYLLLIGGLLVAGGVGFVVRGIVNPVPHPGKSISSVPIYGGVETICLPGEALQLEAKLDTGAETSSLDARDIEQISRDGEPWVRFVVEGLRDGNTTRTSIERPVERRIKVRGAGGSDHRFVVRMQLTLGNQEYDEQFSLRDRSDMNYPVLLGRRTLKHLGAVDVNQDHIQTLSCKP